LVLTDKHKLIFDWMIFGVSSTQLNISNA